MAPADLDLGVDALAATLVGAAAALLGPRASHIAQKELSIECTSSFAAPRCVASPTTATSATPSFVREAKTRPIYRLHSVDGKHPGIYEGAKGGVAIAGEVYELTGEQHAHLISTEPPNLYEAPVQLEDGRQASAR